MSSVEDPANPRQRTNLMRSFMLGPVRSLVPALLNIALIPIIVAKGGLHAVGLWGTINLAVSVFLLCDFGLSQYISRALSMRSHAEIAIRNMAEAALGLWLALAVCAAGAMLLFAPPILRLLELPLDLQSLAGLLLVTVAGLCALYSGMFVFLHISAHQVPFAQVNQVVGALVQFGAAIVLLQIAQPYLALSGAICTGNVVRAAGLYMNLRRIGLDAAPRGPSLTSPRSLAGLIFGSKGFALLSASQQLFHAVNRSAILAFGDMKMLGAFEIASRIPFLLEQAFGNGLQPLFAVFSATDWNRAEERKKLRDLAQWIFKLLVVTSSTCLAVWIALSGPVIGLWLDLADPRLVLATQVLAVLNAVRSFNAPTFWFVQARGGETALGAIYMIQALLLFPAIAVVETVSPPSLLVIVSMIAALGILAELFALVLAQFRFGYLQLVFEELGSALPVAMSAMLLTCAWLVAAPAVHRAAALRAGFWPTLAMNSVWVAALFFVSGGRPATLLRAVK